MASKRSKGKMTRKAAGEGLGFFLLLGFWFSFKIKFCSRVSGYQKSKIRVETQ